MTNDDILKIVVHTCRHPVCAERIEYNFTRYELFEFARLVASAEREECAKICEQMGEGYIGEDWYDDDKVAYQFKCAAKAIRSRTK